MIPIFEFVICFFGIWYSYLSSQLNNLKDMILQDVGKPFDNATLERVRHIDTTVRRSPSKHSPMPPAAAARMMMEAVEESVRVGFISSPSGCISC